MDGAVLFGVMLFMVLPFMVFHLWALIDVLKTPTSAWAAAEQNQVVWAIVVLVLAFVGPILYLFIARPQVVAARTADTPAS